MKKRNLMLVCALICTLFTFSAGAENITLSSPVYTPVRVDIVVCNYPAMTTTSQTLNFDGLASTQPFTCGCTIAPGGYYSKVTSMTFTLASGETFSFTAGELPARGETKYQYLPRGPYKTPCTLPLTQNLYSDYTFEISTLPVSTL